MKLSVKWEKHTPTKTRIEYIRESIKTTEDVIKLHWNANHWPNIISNMRLIVDLIEYLAEINDDE